MALHQKENRSMNAFATGNADTIRELLTGPSGDLATNDSDPVWRGRAVALIGAVVPALVWLRDNKGVPLNVDVILVSIERRSFWRLAMEKRFAARDPNTGIVTKVDVSNEIPEDIILPLQAYLGDLPGYGPSVSLDSENSREPSKQQIFAQYHYVEWEAWRLLRSAGAAP